MDNDAEPFTVFGCSELHFYAPQRGVDVVQHYTWTQPPLLLSVMRELALPVYWKCHHGTCGACAVRVQRQKGVAQPIILSGKERNVLQRHGYLSVGEESTLDAPARWRLACLLTLPAGVWQIAWGEGI